MHAIELNKELEDLCSKVSREIHAINSGGCAVFAVALGEALAQYVPVRVAVYNYGSRLPSFKDVVFECGGDIRALDYRDFKERGIQFNHVCVEYYLNGNWYAVDSNRTQRVDEDFRFGRWGCPLDERVSLYDMRILADNPYNWNSFYDRSNNDKMADMLNTGVQTIMHNLRR